MNRPMHVDGEAMVELELVVSARRMTAEDVVMIDLRDPRGADLPAWEPGAHVDLVLAPDLVRQYSLCGHPADRSTWTIGVLRASDSRGGSRYVHERLPEGTLIRVRGPRNNFPLLAADRYLFIAGGIGITPILPMVAAVDAAGAEWRLVYGGRSRESMAMREELQSRYGNKVDVRPQDETGLLDLPVLLGEPVEGTMVYCCGPEPLLAAVEDNCRRWPPGSLRVERFTPKVMPKPELERKFEVVLDKSGLALVVSSEKSILEEVEAAGVQVDWSCREGTCGTCETRVLDGTPDHRDSLLSEEERAANATMMICVSRAASSRLVLDL